MSVLRKQGECKECGQPLYGDDYGPGGHKCPKAMPPFRAWVAWHPEHGTWTATTESTERRCAARLVQLERRLRRTVNGLEERWFPSMNTYAHERPSAKAMKQDGWRIIEVECVPVEAKHDEPEA